MAGSLFGSTMGLLLICTLSTIGVSICYLLSKICGIEKVISNYLPNQLVTSKISLENLVSSVLIYNIFKYIYHNIIYCFCVIYFILFSIQIVVFY